MNRGPLEPALAGHVSEGIAGPPEGPSPGQFPSAGGEWPPAIVSELLPLRLTLFVGAAPARRACDAVPFSMAMSLDQITFDCGPLSCASFAAADRGHFGFVLCGTLRGSPVAVKFLLPRVGVSPVDARDAFFAEAANMLEARNLILRARALHERGAPLLEDCDLADESRRCRQRHDLRGYRHLVLVHGVGIAHGLAELGLPSGPVFFIVMEQLSGGTLASQFPLSLAEATRTSVEVAGGLAALAAAHIVHADLHPGNIMFRSIGGDVVITDLGVSRVSNAGVNVALYSRGIPARGMELYFAPELISGSSTNTFASDV